MTPEGNFAAATPAKKLAVIGLEALGSITDYMLRPNCANWLVAVHSDARVRRFVRPTALAGGQANARIERPGCRSRQSRRPEEMAGLKICEKAD